MLSSKAASRRQVRHAGSFHELDVAPPIPSKRFIIKKKPRQNIDIHPKVENSEEQAKETERLAEELLSTSKPKKTTTAQRATRTSGDKPHVALSLIRSRTGGGGGGSGRGGAGAPRRTADLGRESLSVALPQDVPVLDAEALDDKEKEKEYWRRQRRMFARSRFITNEEAADVARRVYCNRTIPTNHRMVITFQANIANFRSKWRKLLKEIVKGLKIPKSLVTDGDNEALLREVRSKVDMDMLHAVWGHWISEPFVKVDAFYANTEAVDTLTEVTIKAIYITLRSLYGNLQEKDFRRELDDLDKWTRPMYLPDPLEGQV
ncbi:hypothetical protein DFQ28_004857 [Apophysomyces sp. BC1034]|nr:hypothetical protein DFQ29_004512 [Apophysomyces sp. BC1021]KAG0193524.1 hypothetical protein DFQ28_004857 [Apophysomyces sp. BC1034]